MTVSGGSGSVLPIASEMRTSSMPVGRPEHRARGGFRYTRKEDSASSEMPTYWDCRPRARSRTRPLFPAHGVLVAHAMDAVPVAAHVQGFSVNRPWMLPMPSTHWKSMPGMQVRADGPVPRCVHRSSCWGRRTSPPGRSGLRSSTPVPVPNSSFINVRRVSPMLTPKSYNRYACAGIGRLEVHGAGVLPDSARSRPAIESRVNVVPAIPACLGAVHAEVRRARHSKVGRAGAGGDTMVS